MSAVLFDLDGTLSDPREGITRSIAYALERLGIEPPALDLLTFAIGPPLRESLARLIGTTEREAVERALALYRERFADVGLFENALYPGMKDAISELRRSGTPMFVATSKPLVYAIRIVRHFGLESSFEAVHGCELDGTRENKVELLEHLVGRHALDSGHCTMIGDRGVDMIAARRHGMRAVGALWGYGSREELVEGGANLICGSPHDLALMAVRQRAQA